MGEGAQKDPTKNHPNPGGLASAASGGVDVTLKRRQPGPKVPSNLVKKTGKRICRKTWKAILPLTLKGQKNMKKPIEKLILLGRKVSTTLRERRRNIGGSRRILVEGTTKRKLMFTSKN